MVQSSVVRTVKHTCDVFINDSYHGLCFPTVNSHTIPFLSYNPISFLFVVLVFYGPSTLFMSFRARSVNLSLLFLEKPPRQFTSTYESVHSFASNWQLPFLNQRKGENGRLNYFMIKLHQWMLPDVRIEPATVRIPWYQADADSAELHARL